MKPKFYLFIFVFCVSSLSVLQAQQVISSAGANATGTGVQLSWTVGEPMIETFTGAGVILTQGFQQSKLGVNAIDDIAMPGISLSVYPNPVTWNLKLEVSGIPAGKLEYQLFDLQGKLLFMKKLDRQPEQINMGIYPSGSYLLKVNMTENKHLQTFKIVKN